MKKLAIMIIAFIYNNQVIIQEVYCFHLSLTTTNICNYEQLNIHYLYQQNSVT